MVNITTCIECGKQFQYKTNKSPRCKDCKLKRRTEYSKKYKKTSKYRNSINIKKRKNKDLLTACKVCSKAIKYKNCIPLYCHNCRKIIKVERRKKRILTIEQEEKIHKYQKEYREKNKQKLIEYQRKYRQTEHGKETIKLHNKAIKQTDRHRLNVRSRRLRKKEYIFNIFHDFTQKDWNDKVKLTNGICPMCKLFVGIEKITLDHIFPLSKATKGEHYTIDDVQPLCRNCNSRKNDKLKEEE